VTGSKRPSAEWYTPYFAPTTVLIAVTVLIVSIEAGKYVGNYFIQRDHADMDLVAATAAPVVSHAPTKPAAHSAHLHAHTAVSGKTQN